MSTADRIEELRNKIGTLEAELNDLNNGRTDTSRLAFGNKGACDAIERQIKRKRQELAELEADPDKSKREALNLAAAALRSEGLTVDDLRQAMEES